MKWDRFASVVTFWSFESGTIFPELGIQFTNADPSKNLTDHKLGVTNATRPCYHVFKNFPGSPSKQIPTH